MLNSSSVFKLPMRWIYSLLYTVAFVLASPYFLVYGLVRGKYLSTIGQRLGFGLPQSQQPSIWIHAVSVGEYLAAKSLIHQIRREFPEIPLFVSTTTKTGQKLAKEMVQDSAFYFPFDWRWCVRRFFHKIRPRLILILETEIWPNFLWEAENQKIPIILVNGRISDRSFRRYHRMISWMPRFQEYLMQSKEDAARILALGAASDRVSVMGNLKFDFQPAAMDPSLRRLIQEWKGTDLLWIVGSTMKGEEQILIQAFQDLNRNRPFKLLIAPRHPERFEEVAQLIRQNHLSMIRRTDGKAGESRVMLLDTIGELAACYETADVVTIGGTFGAYGGHNPIEPAYFGKAILAGPHYENFRAVFEELKQHRGILITTRAVEDLAKLLRNPDLRDQMGNAAKSLVQKSAGATNVVLQKVRESLHGGSSMGPVPKLSV